MARCKFSTINKHHFLPTLFTIVSLLFITSCGDDDEGVEDGFEAIVSVQASDATAQEGGNNGEFTVSLDKVNSSGNSISINFSLSGTATSGADYAALGGSVQIPDGSMSASISLSVIDDDEMETDETVVLTINSGGLPTGITVGSGSSATITIEDNDDFSAEVNVTASDDSGTEGSDNIEFTISLDKTNTTGAALTIPYSISGTAASGSDFTTLSGSVNINNNQTSATVAVVVTDDADVENDETVILTLGTLPDGLSAGSSSSATATIIDNDGPTTPFTVTIEGMTSANESNMGTGFGIRLNQTNDTGSDITVNYTLGGTATGGSDYTTPSGSAVISNGETERMVNIPLINDMDDEGDETIIITLSNVGLPGNVSLGSPNVLTITIIDDDQGTGTCANDNSIDMDNFACDESPSVSNSYSETINGDTRTVTTNGIPTHNFRNQIPMIVSDLNADTKVFNMDRTPALAANTTSLTNNGMPAFRFGVATNGVAIDPAPAQPFIFEDANTGEFNFDWVFEPNFNMAAVGLDCAIAHVQPDGTYHYHGDMAVYADQLLSGLGTGSTVPTNPVQIGWAADGYPILYKFGPNAMGNLAELASSYRIKSGDRPGDGVSEPCGEFNGKYTNDFEFVSGLGDLDECNGISQSITISSQTFDYFYVITDEFPIIPRCISGTPDNSFRLGM